MNNQLLFKMLEGQNIDNKYYLKSLLGTGGFGGVYLKEKRQLQHGLESFFDNFTHIDLF